MLFLPLKAMRSVRISLQDTFCLRPPLPLNEKKLIIMHAARTPTLKFASAAFGIGCNLLQTTPCVYFERVRARERHFWIQFAKRPCAACTCSYEYIDTRAALSQWKTLTNEKIGRRICRRSTFIPLIDLQFGLHMIENTAFITYLVVIK
jgi:hypothetical protein